jgi:hypothetical protein
MLPAPARFRAAMAISTGPVVTRAIPGVEAVVMGTAEMSDMGAIEWQSLRPKRKHVVSASGVLLSNVMRTSVLVFAVMLTACAANPRSLCESLVPNSWTPLPRAPEGTRDLEASLPTAPYRTNEGLVTSVQRLWYEKGDELIACTLPRHATDNSSVMVTDFARSGGTWVKVSDDAYLCHVTL